MALFEAKSGDAVVNALGPTRLLGFGTSPAVLASPSLRLAAISSGAGTIEIWDCQSGRLIYETPEGTLASPET
jgi:hypothetical protein